MIRLKTDMSKNDLKRGIKLPDKITSDLAEDVGFHIGDGYMKKRIDNYGIHYDFAYSGSDPDDLAYFRDVLIPRKLSIFNLSNLRIQKHKTKNAIFLKFQSKAVFLFYKNVLCVQESPKTDIRIPIWIFDSIDLQKSALRGLIDSDGNFKIVKKGYPMISFSSQSKGLTEDIGRILKNLSIPFSSFKILDTNKVTKKVYTKFYVQIS